MAKLRLSIISSTGSYLLGSNVSQHQHPSITISDDTGKEIISVDLTFNQLALFLCSGQTTECTIRRVSTKDVETEVVEPPPTLKERAQDAFEETFTEIRERIKSLHARVYDLINGGGKAGKKELLTILGDIDTIHNHYSSNHGFMLQEAQEEVEAMRDEVVTQISSFIASSGGDPQLGQSFIPSLPNLNTEKIKPVPIEPSDYKKVIKIPEEMTDMELGDGINNHLKRIESLGYRREKGAILFGANACQHPKGGVSIRYVSYQGMHVMTHEKAISYLKFLRTVKTGEEFKTDWGFEGKE